MFEAGQYIVYGTTGVCVVEDVKEMDLMGDKQLRQYYVLEPVYDKKSKVYIPVDNKNILMRPLLSNDKAMELIDHSRELELLRVADERHREDIYKTAMQSGDCEEWMKVLKTLQARKEERISHGKKVTSMDARYTHMVEASLYGELAVVLGIPKDSVEEFIAKRVEMIGTM